MDTSELGLVLRCFLPPVMVNSGGSLWFVLRFLNCQPAWKWILGECQSSSQIRTEVMFKFANKQVISTYTNSGDGRFG